MTKAEVLALNERRVNELVAESVLGWTRVAAVEVGEEGSVSVEHAWVQVLGQAQVQRADGGQVDAPRHRIIPVDRTPDFADEKWVPRIMARMARQGFRLAFQRDAGGDVVCSFTAAGGTPDPVTLPNASDAVRRAAVLAVQS